jgi:ABC-type branched-subunit amino acid transport system substrate-binding protein
LSRPWRTIAAAAAMLMTMVLLAAGCTSDGSSNFKLKIGTLLPLTGQRDQLGEAGKEATKLAQAQIDTAIRKNGSGHTVTMLSADEGPDPGVTVNSATKLREDKASCIVGPYSSANALVATNQVFVPGDIPIISPAASADPISRVKDGDLINRTVLPDADQGPSLAAYMDKELKGAKGKTVSVGSFDSIYGTNLLKAFVDSWKKLGGKVAGTTAWRDKSDYTKDVKKLTGKKPDAYVFFDNTSTFGRIVTQLGAIKTWKAKKTFASDALADPVLTVNPTMYGMRGIAPGSPDDTPAGKAFDAAFAKATKGKVDRQSFDAQAFDAYVLCYLGAVAAGSSNGGKLADQLRAVSGPPGQKFTWMQLPEAVKALERGKEIDYEGASGPIDLNAHGDPTSGTYDSWKITKEKIAIGEDVPFPPEL